MKKVRLHRANARGFGRLTTGAIDLTGHDFVVVYGPNEAGKSTLADMLSWILAGRRLEGDYGRRYANFRNRPDETSITIGGQVEGSFDEQSFTVSRDFKIRKSSKGKEAAAPEPVVFLNGAQISESNWSSLIGIANGDQYHRQFRITGPYDPDNHVDITSLLEALTVGTSVTTSPGEIMSRLNAAADKLVHNTSGRNSGERRFKKANDQYEAAKARVTQIQSEAAQVGNIDRQITAAEATCGRLDEELLELHEERSALETARELSGTRAEGASAAEVLANMPDIDQERLRAHAVEAEVLAAVKRVDLADQDVIKKEAALEVATKSAGITEEQAGRIVVTSGAIETVEQIARDRASAEGAAHTADQTIIEKGALLDSLNQQLEVLAEELHTSTDHLLRLENLSMDDSSFGDPVRDWVEATRGTPGLQSDLDTSIAAEKKAQDEFDEIDKQWDKSKIPTSPRVVAEGRGTVFPSTNFRSSLTIGLAGVVVVTAIAASLHQIAGFVVAILGLTGVWLLSKNSTKPVQANSPREESKEIVALAHNWVSREKSLEAARTTREVRETALSQHTGRLAGLESNARSVLMTRGFVSNIDVDLASTIRSQRGLITKLTGDLRRCQEELGAAKNARSQAKDSMRNLTEQLIGIAEDIGCGHLGDQLTGVKVRQAQEIQGLVTSVAIAQAEAGTARQSLEELAGPWSKYLSTGEITKEMSVIANHVRTRSQLENTRVISEEAIRTRAPRGSRTASILDDPEMTPDVIDNYIARLRETIQAKATERSGTLVQIGALQNQLESLASQSDLPIIKQQMQQAEVDRFDASLRGAALLLAEKIVADVKDEVERANQPTVIKKASEFAIRITGGAWSGLVVASDQQIVVGQNDSWMEQLSLSAGARDVLRLSIRIAFAEQHAEKSGVALPVILDDPTASVDQTRAPRLFEVLAEFSSRHQVIVMTHDPSTVELATSAGAKSVDLTRLA